MFPILENETGSLAYPKRQFRRDDAVSPTTNTVSTEIATSH
jgi:hypothetical protein